jgi:hypothetical protein
MMLSAKAVVPALRHQVVSQVVTKQHSSTFLLRILLFIYEAGVELRPLLLQPFTGLLYQPWITCDDCGAISRMNEWQGKPKHLEKTSPSAAMSTTDPT